VADKEQKALIPRLAITPAGGIEGDAFFSGTREARLGYIVNVWRPYFDHAGAPLPARIWVSVGPPGARHLDRGMLSRPSQ
jgi:hypothetical protein